MGRETVSWHRPVAVLASMVSLGRCRPSISGPRIEASVICTSLNDCIVAPWAHTSWTARAVLVASQNETGWATLAVETPRGIDDRVAAYSAGYIEGFLTASMIQDSWFNFVATNLTPSAETQVFLEEQAAWVQERGQEVREGSKVSRYWHDADWKYWHHVAMAYDQLSGLGDGYKYAAAKSGLQELNASQIMWLNMNVEFDDIAKSVKSSSRENFALFDAQMLKDYQRNRTHCSALVKVTPGLEDLFLMHTTWWSYTWMLRIIKAYTLRYSTTSAETVIQSGFPGFLISSDDFYTTSQKLGIVETSLNIYNNSLYDLITPQSVPYWVRNTVANQLASTGRDWHELFYRENSGTYNNQWIVVDYKGFEPGRALHPWTLSVSESLPGTYFHGGEDKTNVLQFGHWPSYNSAFFPDVYAVSGVPSQVSKFGVNESYQLAPRARIFRRDAAKVNSLEDLKLFARLNHYGHDDPLAAQPDFAIASRADLDPINPKASGAIDAKVVSHGLMNAMAVSAISGPTAQGQPVFSFGERWSKVPHAGVPERFDFAWQTYSLASLSSSSHVTNFTQMAPLVINFV